MREASPILSSYLSLNQRELLEDGKRLIQHVSEENLTNMHDYSFVVFPYAKAFEGFLKKFFFDMGFIDEHTYRGSRFRIGKALNPKLETELRHESIYDKLEVYCGDGLPDELWNVWKMGRNLLFHYFPHNENKISFQQALSLQEEIVAAMEHTLVACRITQKPKVT